MCSAFVEENCALVVVTRPPPGAAPTVNRLSKLLMKRLQFAIAAAKDFAEDVWSFREGRATMIVCKLQVRKIELMLLEPLS
jgi:hypothetical protein